MSYSTSGIDHIGLTVKDLTASTNFFINCLGFKKVGERPEYPAVFVADDAVMMTLWQAKDDAEILDFDRRHHIGLHHLAFRVPNHEQLDQLFAKIKNEQTINIEFAPETLGTTEARHFMIHEPSGNRIEFISRNA
ncbi:VOC family protein [Lactococcus allomyrinae]|uniref:Glyoxalase n=1 Tax=Lactococcus allomyrinae TaxID=2419773 RepID=A0A387BGU4_9LACT|nr:VOC family protein [Lactococcus allomyrinae]AYG00080.1 glyoxalase [Lactococcus allomyrinae]